MVKISIHFDDQVAKCRIALQPIYPRSDSSDEPSMYNETKQVVALPYNLYILDQTPWEYLN
jgi:hypothetical protein